MTSTTDAVQDVINTYLKASGKVSGPKTILEAMEAFCSAVDWSEPWLQILLAFHVGLYLFVWLGRNSLEILMSALICAGTQSTYSFVLAFH